ncbi:MAG: branched-chain amino acid transport system II carrier protein [Simkaniaceae bacterium]|nr:branched-chain amino acid transport system II carrier protein [Simkaniaceae bacterium]
MSQGKVSSSFSNGLAMFSMFFGAGNITFPLAIGLAVQGGLPYALCGLIITAVMMPFAGLMAITLFNGDYEPFFQRMGKIPGFMTIVILLLLIGPFGGIPRCITITYSTMKVYFPSFSLVPFSLLACLLLYVMCLKRTKILSIIGNVLSPVLLVFLMAIVIKGLFFTEWRPLEAGHTPHPFWYGLVQGYNTMDLLAAFFFSSLVCTRLKREKSKSLVAPVLKASCIGGGLLSLIYIGFSYVAARHSVELSDVPMEQLLGTLGHIVLGPYAGFFVCMSISLTCLTTALALTVICAEFIRDKLLHEKVRFQEALIGVLLISLLVCTLEFHGIVHLLMPVLTVIYPALLVLSLSNMMYKLYSFQRVKLPVYLCISFSLFVLLLKTL